MINKTQIGFQTYPLFFVKPKLRNAWIVKLKVRVSKQRLLRQKILMNSLDHHKINKLIRAYSTIKEIRKLTQNYKLSQSLLVIQIYVSINMNQMYWIRPAFSHKCLTDSVFQKQMTRRQPTFLLSKISKQLSSNVNMVTSSINQ